MRLSCLAVDFSIYILSGMKHIPCIILLALLCSCSTGSKDKDAYAAQSDPWGLEDQGEELQKRVEERARSLMNLGQAKDYDDALRQAAGQINIEMIQNRNSKPKQRDDQPQMDRALDEAAKGIGSE